MLKLLLASLTVFLFTTIAVHAGSDDMITSANSDFSNPTEKFTAGQTIYVKVNANSQGSKKHDLNLRDNSYKLISSYNLENIGNNTFKTSLAAPQSSGYYSLEARVESEGSTTSSVKTIKVGTGTNNADVKVNVDVHTSTSTNDENQSSQPTPSPQQPEPTPQPEVNGAKDANLFVRIRLFFQNIFSILTTRER